MTSPGNKAQQASLEALFAWIDDFKKRSEHFDDATPVWVWERTLGALALRTVLPEDGLNPEFRVGATKKFRRMIRELHEWDERIQTRSTVVKMGLCFAVMMIAVCGMEAQTPAASPPPVSSQPAPPPPLTASPVATPAPLISLAPPADIASLNAREILAANNAVVGQVATMYQHFGLFITGIVGLFGIIATLMSYLARKNVHDFVEEWDKKLREKEQQIDKALEKSREAETLATRSAAEAARHARSIEESRTVLSQSLDRADELRAQVDQIRDRLAALASEVREPLPKAVTPSPETPPPPSTGQAVDDPISTSEEASVADRLRGRLPPESPSTAS